VSDPAEARRLRHPAWFETRAKGALLTMTESDAAHGVSQGEGDQRERLEPRTNGAASPLERLTPQAAVDAAAWRVNGPVLLIMLAPALATLAFGLVAGAPFGQFWPVAGMVLIVSWLAAWLVWSILTPRWRLWAYERVEDIDELKRIAIADRVLWPEGHIIHRSELAPPVLRAKLEMIEAERRAEAEARAQVAAPAVAKARPKARGKAAPKPRTTAVKAAPKPAKPAKPAKPKTPAS